MPEISYHELSEKRMANVVNSFTAPTPHARFRTGAPPTPIIGPCETVSKIREKPRRIVYKEPAQSQNPLEKYFVDACNAIALYRTALASANKIEAFEVHKLWHQLDKLKP